MADQVFSPLSDPLSCSERAFYPEVSSCSPQATVLLPCTTGELAAILSAMHAKALELFADGMCAGVPGALECVIVTDGPMAALNHRAMGVTGPTNILSFPGAPLDSEASLVLSSETLVRESFLYGQELFSYLVRLLAHGMGHVCGFDHGDAMDAFSEALERSVPDSCRNLESCRA